MATTRTDKGLGAQNGRADRPSGDSESGEEAGREQAIGPLSIASETPDGLTDLVQPPPASLAEEPAEGLRISTILGPLPARVSVQKTRDLNDAVHRILVIGLAISTVLLVAGLLLQLVTQGALPAQTLAPGEALRHALALQPAGLISLGLLALLFTPVVRVIGSVIVFVWERDRLYAIVTLVVLAVMSISVFAGRG